MRDLDRWKDKVELSLDGRQIFFLFFGSAVAACLIFVVGVLIGKRLEARALALTPPAIEDPLAALDQLGDADDAAEGLTFHRALTRAPKLDEKRAPPIAMPPIVEAPRALPPSLAVEVAPPRPSQSPQAQPTPKAQVKAPLPAAKPQIIAKHDPTSAHFTLQLSSFPERADAEAFMRKIQSAGYKPFLLASEIPGKGVFFRVRVGDFASKDAASSAKTEFERKQRMIVYVAKL